MARWDLQKNYSAVENKHTKSSRAAKSYLFSPFEKMWIFESMLVSRVFRNLTLGATATLFLADASLKRFYDKIPLEVFKFSRLDCFPFPGSANLHPHTKHVGKVYVLLGKRIVSCNRINHAVAMEKRVGAGNTAHHFYSPGLEIPHRS